MAEDSRYYPFTSGDGSTVTERDWGDMASDWSFRSGVRMPSPLYESNPLNVTQRDSSSVNVSPGRAKIAGYHYRLNSSTIVNIPNFDSPDRERIDYVAVTVDATQPISPGSLIEIRVRTGTESTPGSAAAPPHYQLWDSVTGTPGLWDLPLARVRSVAGDPIYDEDNVSIIGYAPVIQRIDDVRTYINGNQILVNSANYPNHLSDGQLIWRSDLRRLAVWDGQRGAAAPIAQVGPAESFTPRVTGLTSGYTAVGRYMYLTDKLVWVSVQITATKRVTPNGVDVRVYLPVRDRGGIRNAMLAVQHGTARGNSVNITMGEFGLRGEGFGVFYFPDPDDNDPHPWELDLMGRESPGTCLLNEAGNWISFQGIYDAA